MAWNVGLGQNVFTQEHEFYLGGLNAEPLVVYGLSIRG
jgi:hypothetical protein